MLEFSAILSAVKRRDRTDQYCVLAALYFLAAYREPVTAKQLNDLLKLHLGTAAPKNVSAALRKYNSFVEVAAKGPPLRWSLTNKGLNQLRTQSGLALLQGPSETDFETDIAFLCALQPRTFAGRASYRGCQPGAHTESCTWARTISQFYTRA